LGDIVFSVTKSLNLLGNQMTQENPLKQYFRRPALYLSLPSNGIGYASDVIDFPENKELPVYPMTAIDEITSRTPDALYNGLAVVEIIKSCIPAIKKPWEILNVDLDPILVAIKMATNGQAMELETACPSCEETSKYDVNLTGILASFKPGDYSKSLELNDLKIKFKPSTYKEVNAASTSQFEIQKILYSLDSVTDEIEKNKKTADVLKTINTLTMSLIVNSIEYIKTPESTVFDKDHIREFLENCDKNTHNTIKETHIELRKSTELKPLEIKCMHCSHEYQQQFNINISDFFD
jgi:hypothetical protein